VTDWQPISSAPACTRVLVCSRGGHVQIARKAALRWYDDDERLMAVPEWWAPLPEGPPVVMKARAATAASAIAGSKTVKRRRPKPRA
jgi:hypothetical protein